MPVRATADDPPVDDYLVWCSNVEAPIFRGTRHQVTAFWRRSWGEQRPIGVGFERLFERADNHGSSTRLSANWGDPILCMETPGKSGLLPRHRIREFADLMFPGYPQCDVADEAAITANAEKITALLEPFDDDVHDDEHAAQPNEAQL